MGTWDGEERMVSDAFVLTLVEVLRLLEKGALVEVEATAVIPDQHPE